MNFVSKLALAAALTLGGTAMTATPALAQKSKKAEKDEGPKLSDEFRAPAAAADVAVQARDWAAAEPQIAAAEAVAKTDVEKYYAARMRFMLENTRNSAEGQLRALQVLVNNPNTPAHDLKIYQAQNYYLLGEAASDAKKPAEAIPLLLKAREAGSPQPDIAVTLAKAYSDTNHPNEAVAELDTAIKEAKAAGRKPSESWYKYAISKVNAGGDRAALAGWLSRYILDFPTAANWRWAVVTFRETAGQPAATDRAAKTARIDTYRLMRATNVLADRSDYAGYANDAQLTGLPWEAISVIEEGRKAGKVQASDSDVNRIYQSSQTQVKSEGSLDKLAAQASAGSAREASATGDAFLSSGNYTRALELYDLALTKSGVDANEVNLHRGIALRALGRKDEARTAFQAVTSGQFANLAILWTASLDLPPLS